MPQLSSLNGFNAAYLFLVLALIMMVFFLIWKSGVFAYLSAFGWAAMAVYAFNSAEDNATVIMLGLFCLLCLVVSIMLPILFRPKKELPPKPMTRKELSLAHQKHVEEIRNTGRPAPRLWQ
jgi:hypothetical protein